MAAQNFRSFAIFGAMRSGSNLLERLINQFDGLKCHGELFNPGFIGWSGQQEYRGISRADRDAAPGLLLEAILKQDPQNMPGFRIFRDHNAKAIEQFLADKTCAKIILTRDPIDSFVSLKIAQKTNQWLIHDETHRKVSRIYFDLEEYETYKKTRKAYVEKITSALNSSGQSYFDIHFDHLLDLEKINRLAAFLGGKNPRKWLDQPIKRQNPEALSDKIINYRDVFAPLGLPDMPTNPSPLPLFKPEKGTSLSRAYFCENQSIVFAPIPSAPDGRIVRWLTDIDGLAPANNFGKPAYEYWCETHKNPAVFTVLRHPVQRAYDVFMRKIFHKNPGGFSAIREALEKKYGMVLPDFDTPLEDIGYDATAHRTAFLQFLAFIHLNLAQKTDLRTDGRWRLQSRLIDGYENILGPCKIFFEEDLKAATSLANYLKLPETPADIAAQDTRWRFELVEIYSSEVEILTRAAYDTDYQKFGFKNWA